MSSAGVRAIVRNTALLAVAQTVGTATRLVYVVMVARLLGPELYALLAYSQSWYLAFLPLALFGLGPALIQLVAATPARTASVAAHALGLRVALTALAAAACVGLSLAVVPDPRAPVLIAVLTLALVGRAVTAWAQHVYLARELNEHTVRQEVAFRLLEVGAALAVLLGGGGLLALVTVHATAWCLQALWSLRTVGARVQPLQVALGGPDTRALLALAMPFLLIQLLAEWRIQGPLILFRNATTDGVLFGQFALAMQAMLIAGSVPLALGTAAQPPLTRSAARADGRDLEYASALQRLAFVGGTAAGILGLALGPALCVAALGAEYAAAGGLVGLTLWCLIPLTAGYAFPLVFVARGELRSQLLPSFIASVLMTALLPLLARPLGAAGAILAAGIGFAVPPLWAFTVAVQRGWAGWGALLVRPMLGVLASLAVFLSLAPLSTVAAACAALLTLAAVSALSGALTRADVALLRELIRR